MNCNNLIKNYYNYIKLAKFKQNTILNKNFLKKNVLKKNKNNLINTNTDKYTKLAKTDFDFVNKNYTGDMLDLKKTLRILTKSNVHLVFINALSFLRFSYRIDNTNQTEQE
jgi:hypothetical protein